MKRADGKILKPEGWAAPDIVKVVQDMRIGHKNITETSTCGEPVKRETFFNKLFKYGDQDLEKYGVKFDNESELMYINDKSFIDLQSVYEYLANNLPIETIEKYI